MKDFDLWNSDKKIVDTRKTIHVKIWQIWHCKLWVNIWSEENGKWWFLRPVLILQIIWNMVFVVPLTTNTKWLYHPLYYQLQWIDFWTHPDWSKKVSLAMLAQCRMIDTKRCIIHKWTIPKNEHKLILSKVIDLLHYWWKAFSTYQK